MNTSTHLSNDTLQQRRMNNRRIGIILGLLACSVFVSVIFRQWVTGGV